MHKKQNEKGASPICIFLKKCYGQPKCMRAFFISLFVAMLISGCASPEAKPEADGAEPPAAQQQAQEKPVSTSNLSFSREFDTEEILVPETKFPETPTFNFSNITTADGRLIVYYFMSSGCIASRELQPEIDRLQGRYPKIEWHTYDILTQNGTWAYLAFADQYGLSPDKRMVPQVLVNGTIITDRFNINESLEGIIS